MTTTETKTQAQAISEVTAATSSFVFYDLESLANAFTMCAYQPPTRTTAAQAHIFYLIDDAADGTNLADQLGQDTQSLLRTILTGNPGLSNDTVFYLYDLRKQKDNEALAQLIGLSNADQVGLRLEQNTSSFPEKFRPVCDTDDEYHPAIHYFLAGYNSHNYDTTMLGCYLNEVFSGSSPKQLKFTPVKAATMRAHNDTLFAPENIDYMPGAFGWQHPAAKIRRAMISSGRHLDVARLNELQFKVSLKRLLGMLGHQIKESDRLSHNTTLTSLADLHELISYNIADCLGLAHLFDHPTYSGNFDLKAGLLATYPDTRYERDGVRLRKDRLTIDSSSAKFVGRILAPTTPLKDIETVSFDYPHPDVAAEQGIEVVNVLDQCIRFFETNVAPAPARDPEATPAQRAAHAAFMEIVAYYRSIEGKNFNSSEGYRDNYQKVTQYTQANAYVGAHKKSELPHEPHVLRDIPKRPNNIPYFHADATPSSCFATFSTGGIHGAEADLSTLMLDQAEHRNAQLLLQTARRLYPRATDFVAAAKDQHNQIPLPDGTFVDKRLVLFGSDPDKVRYLKPKKENPAQVEALERAMDQVPDAADLLSRQRPAAQELDLFLTDPAYPTGYLHIPGKVVLDNTTISRATYREEPTKKKPVLFVTKEPGKDASTKLHPRYVRTSAALVVHEDFTSYYPNLLRNMRAFYNPELGQDRYADIFFEKEALGAQLKDPGLDPATRARLTTLRNGTKLILNSASGAGDAGHDTPIRMNNTIISMRIIGQLFSWMVGQAQTLAGARIISTNTDGLYSVVSTETGEDVFTEQINNEVLLAQQAQINIDIEPELMYLISKDSNNRLELSAPPPGGSVADSAILSASGGTLAAHAGPSPNKSLSHPAVIDFALARYLRAIAAKGQDALAAPFDDALGAQVIAQAINTDDPVATLLLFQNVVTASRGSITYPFAVDPAPVADQPTQSTEGLEPGQDEVATDEAGVSNSEVLNNPTPLQMVNRVFVVKAGTAGAVNLYNAGAWKVTPLSQKKRRQSGVMPVVRDEVALDILRAHGWAKDAMEVADNPELGLRTLPGDQDVAIRRNNGIDPSWPMLVLNEDLHHLQPDQAAQLIKDLDLTIYTGMLKHTYTQNWRNAN